MNRSATLSAALLGALVAIAAPAQAATDISGALTPPDPATYRSYRIRAVGGTLLAMLLEGRRIEAESYYDGHGGFLDYWAQLPFYCNDGNSCAALGIRHMNFTPTYWQFSFYGPPRPFDNCNPARSTPPNRGKICASTQLISSFGYTAQVSDGADIMVTDLASGAVPEPASWALMITGFGLVGSALRRRRTANA